MEDLVRSIEPHLVPAMLVIARIGGMFLFSPLLSSNAVPVRFRVGLAFLIGLAVYPALDREVFAHAPVALDLAQLAPVVALEILLGAVVGWAATVPLAGVQTGGNLVGQQLGLSFAQIFDPATESQTDVVGQLLFILAMGAFIAMDGLEILFDGLVAAFAWVPAGGYRPDASTIQLAAGLLGMAFELALRVAIPVLAIVFVESIAMGFTSKSVPQLNILSLGFPLRILSGTVILVLGLHVIGDVVMDSIEEMLAAVRAWLEAGA